MQLSKIAMTGRPLPATISLPMVASTKGPKVLHPDFGRRVDARMIQLDLTNEAVGKLLGMKKGEMVRRYRKGWAMPRGKRMIKLATLLGFTPTELQWGTPNIPGVKTIPIINVSSDEQILLDGYRRLPDPVKQVARARVLELMEEFVPRGPANPHGKG